MKLNKYLMYSLVMLAVAGLLTHFNGFNETAQMATVFGVVGALAASMPTMTVAGYCGTMLTGADDDPTILATEIRAAIRDLGGTKTRLEEVATDFKGRLEKGEKLSADLKGQVDDLLTKFNIATQNIAELEQKAASGAPGGSASKIKSVGEQFVESDAFKSFNGEGPTSVKATITTVLAGGAAGDGLMAPAFRDPDLVRIPRRVTVDDLIPRITINSSSVDYARQKTRNNNAAMVAEGAQKPYSDYSWESVTVPTRTLAHLAKVTRQAWEDAPRLMGEINSEMIYGLDLLREAQILFGTGTGQNLHGIVPQATDFVMPAGAPALATLNKIDVLRLAMLNLFLRGYQPDGHVLNSADWAFIELMKDGEERYLVASPFTGTRQQLWGLPVLDTPAMTQGDFLTGAFRIGATYYARNGIEIKLSTENDKDFEFNLGTVRAEERGALAVKRPAAFETGNFADILTP